MIKFYIQYSLTLKTVKIDLLGAIDGTGVFYD